MIEGNSLFSREDSPLLSISNYRDFIKQLTLLLKKMNDYCINDKDYFMFDEDNYNRYLLMCCFLNMQEQDFNNPLSYLQRLSNSLDYHYNFNKTNLIGSFSLNENIVNIYETDKKNIASMEATQHKQIILECNGETFLLPRIHYYISNDRIYITGIQNKPLKEKTSFSKKIDRYFRKLDKGIGVEDSYESGINTIKDISPSALAALTIFISLYKKYKKVYMTDYLPLRYQNKIKKIRSEEDIIEIDRVQANATNKFLMTGARLVEHFDNIEGYFNNGILELDISPYTKQTGNIIYELFESIRNNIR